MESSFMNWGRGKGVDYAFVYSHGTYGDDGLDVSIGSVYDNIEEMIEHLKYVLKWQIDDIFDSSGVREFIVELSPDEGQHRKKEELLFAYEAEINTFDEQLAENRLEFHLYSPLKKTTINFTTEDQNMNEKNINLYNAIENYKGKDNNNIDIEISKNNFIDIYMDYVDVKVFNKVREYYSDPKAIAKVKSQLGKLDASRPEFRIFRKQRYILGWDYYQEYYNFSSDSLVSINFFDL